VPLHDEVNGRIDHLRDSMKAGLPTLWTVIGALVLLIGGSVAITAVWGFEHLYWGLVILLAILFAVSTEGSYHLRQRAKTAHHSELEIQRQAHERGLAQERANSSAALEAQRQAQDQELAKREQAAAEAAPKPLEACYGNSARYQRQIRSMTEHRIGLRNPAGNPAAAGVRLEWTEMAPPPRVENNQWERWLPAIPSAVPRAAGGDPAIGVSLPAGQEEMWVVVTTAIGPDGIVRAVEFGSGYGSSVGKWHGLLWVLEAGGLWRLSYRIVSDNLPARTFSLVITAGNGEIQCDLEG
jgi:hypothetical protein